MKKPTEQKRTTAADGETKAGGETGVLEKASANELTKESQRIEVLDFLRGIAALAVAMHHFCNILQPGALRSASYYGQLGVQVFFVISGFIIPYSLYRGGYTLRNYLTFVLKRIVRLDPPYLVTLALIVVLGVLSWYFPMQKGFVFEVSVPQVLLHLGYVNIFFGYPWLNDVFWTLAIEFQYYLLMGLVFPVVFSRRVWVRLAAFAALCSLAFVVPNPAYIFYYLFLFFMGIWTCQYKVGLIGARQYAVLLAVSTLGALAAMGAPLPGHAAVTPASVAGWVQRVHESAPATIAGFATVCAILFLQMKNVVFRFLGTISYSLYLLHSPVGRRALNVLLRVTGAESEAAKIVLILGATAVSIVAAYLLYRYVERPSQQWSQALRYHRRRKPYEVRPEELEQLNPAL